jgi:hypothetical protein
VLPEPGKAGPGAGPGPGTKPGREARLVDPAAVPPVIADHAAELVVDRIVEEPGGEGAAVGLDDRFGTPAARSAVTQAAASLARKASSSSASSGCGPPPGIVRSGGGDAGKPSSRTTSRSRCHACASGTASANQAPSRPEYMR